MNSSEKSAHFNSHTILPTGKKEKKEVAQT
jgi:hypothetical protein